MDSGTKNSTNPNDFHQPPPYTPASGQSAGGYPYPQQQQPAPGQSGGYPYPPQQQPAPGYPTQHQPASTTVYVNQPPNRTNVLAVDLGLPMAGRCGHCQFGIVRERFTICGWLWAIFCFPCGLLCLFSMRVNSCDRCGAVF